MLHGRLLDEYSHCRESLADLTYPVVLLQGSQSNGDGFIECLRSDLYGVLNVLDIFYRNCARSEHHEQIVAYSPFVRYRLTDIPSAELARSWLFAVVRWRFSDHTW